MHCPLCNFSNTHILKIISGKQLNFLFQKMVRVQNALKADQLEYRECPICRLRFYWPMETGSEELYEQLQTFDWYYMTDKEEYKIASQNMPTEGRVLEVGSGRAAFASIVGIDRYTGLEFNDKAIERAASVGITLIKEMVEDHSKHNLHQYGTVVSFQVLEHVNSPADFIKGCVECLNPGGTLILAVPSRDGFAGAAVNNILDMPPHHVTHWSEFTMQKIAELYGLEVVSIKHEVVASYHRYWARKVRIESVFRSVMGIKFKPVDLGFLSQLLSKLSSLIARLSRSSVTGVKGHTVVACYRKK